jgi:formamidopyrimidine-DNA glycosylase
VPAGGSREDATGRLGPEALGLEKEELTELLGSRRGAIKAALMDQKLIAGLGNLLCDEILWRARINPRQPVSTLGPSRVARIHRCTQAVLRESIPHARVPPDPAWLTGARSQGDPRCPRCSTRLSRATIAGRTTVWCPQCQRR